MARERCLLVFPFQRFFALAAWELSEACDLPSTVTVNMRRLSCALIDSDCFLAASYDVDLRPTMDLGAESAAEDEKAIFLGQEIHGVAAEVIRVRLCSALQPAVHKKITDLRHG